MRKVVLAIVAVSAFAAPILLAQKHGPPSAASMVQQRVTRLTTELDLLPPQPEEATMCFMTAITNNGPLETALRTEHKQLATDIKTNPSAVAGDATLIGKTEGEILGNDSTAQACFWGILNSTQQMKFETLEGNGGGWGGPGPGAFGGRPH